MSTTTAANATATATATATAVISASTTPSHTLTSPTTTFNIKHKKSLYERISSLTSTEHEEVFKIIREHNINFSKNKNGIFFNLTAVPDEVVTKIDEFVKYCVSNKHELDEYDKKLNECKINNNFDTIMPLSALGQRDYDDSSSCQEVVTWDNLKPSDDQIDRFQKFVDRMVHERDKIAKRKSNVKFNNAKKKYSKKASCDRKFDVDMMDNLQHEPYIIAATG